MKRFHFSLQTPSHAFALYKLLSVVAIMAILSGPAISSVGSQLSARNCQDFKSNTGTVYRNNQSTGLVADEV